jgi:signal transduction histidine kinase
MKSLLPLDRSSLVTVSDDKTEWQILKQWTSRETAFAPKTWRPVKGSVLEWLLANKKTFVENHFSENSPWPETQILLKEGLASRVLVPLLIKGEVIGVMTIASRIPAVYTDVHVTTLESLAHQVGIALNNAQLYERVQNYNEILENRIQERTAQLESANKELEAFAYSVSHDLRAPLRYVSGFINLLEKRIHSDADKQVQHYLTTISKSATQMGELIDDLLAFSRMGREEIRKMRIPLERLVEEVIAELNSQQSDGREVSWNVTALPQVNADAAMLRLVVMNLLSNAYKFTKNRKQAVIEIGCTQADDEVVVFVRDNGVGFDMQYVDKLFGVFQRLHKSSEFEGTGIGLANVRRIIHRHGGKTWAEGCLNNGATFYFSLPATDMR